MGKDSNFLGQPVFGQIVSLVPAKLVAEIAAKRLSDRYYKKFKTFDHVLTMLYAAMSGVDTLRAVELGLMGASTRLAHVGMARIPPRSTISDGNKLRSSEVFADIYQALNLYYRPLLSDSRLENEVFSRLSIIDSTTMSLFKDILKAAGRSPASGKRKGGIKAQVTMDSATGLPKVVRFSSGASADTPYMKKAKLAKGDIAVFDMGYCDYGVFRSWGIEGIHFVTRQKENALFTVVTDFELSELCAPCIGSDQIIEVVDPGSKECFQLRRIVRKAEGDSQELVFWTNILTLNPGKIAAIYKQRWQIELLFRCLKQNFPLQYFLGDNRNAIEIQIWCCMIAHLLYKVILHQNKTKWAFSNFCDLIRQHLFTYINLAEFVKNPERALRDKIKTKARSPDTGQYQLF
jgi:Transposase DDE domain/Domain of unknown function (DUF4372)